MTGKEIYDSYIVAGILEGAGVAGSLPSWTEDNMETFRGVVRELERATASLDHPDELADIDERFHTTLLMACDNTRLVEMARTSCATISKYLYYQHWITMFSPAEYAARHLAIAEAVASRDGAHVESVLRDHYRETGQRMAEFGVPPYETR